MTIRATILLLTGVLRSTTLFSQDEIKVDILPTKISTNVNLIVYSGQTVVLERYHFFKHNFWMRAFDTLEVLDNGMLKSERIVINPETFRITVDACDSTVNKIRNSALQEEMSSQLRNLAWEEIGYDSEEFRDSIDVYKPTEQQEAAICHEEFKAIIAVWFQERTKRIYEIKKKKTERREWMKNNPDKIDKTFIELFLRDYSTSETDQIAILQIIENYPDEFLTVCKGMSDMSFFKVKLKLSMLPDKLKTDAPIAKLKASQIRTNRKSKLIRKLKKNAR